MGDASGQLNDVARRAGMDTVALQLLHTGRLQLQLLAVATRAILKRYPSVTNWSGWPMRIMRFSPSRRKTVTHLWQLLIFDGDGKLKDLHFAAQQPIVVELIRQMRQRVIGRRRRAIEVEGGWQYLSAIVSVRHTLLAETGFAGFPGEGSPSGGPS